MNATARFSVNAYSVNGGYLEYQWYRSKAFAAPVSSSGVYTEAEINAIKSGATPLSGGVAATLITVTPKVTGTQYYYYWVKISNSSSGESNFVESVPAQAKIIGRTLPDHIVNGDMEYWRSTPVANPKRDGPFYSMGGKDKKGNTFQFHGWLASWHGEPTGNYEGYPAYYPNEAGATFVSDAHYDAGNGWYTTHWKYSSTGATGNLLPYGIIEAGSAADYLLPVEGHDWYVIELGAKSRSNIYQDIATVHGKIYEWSLDHSARPNTGNPQKIAVIIGNNINEKGDYGAGITNRWNIDEKGIYAEGYPYGVNTNSYFNDIVDSMITEQGKDALSIESGGYTVEYNSSTYYVYIGSDVDDSIWTHYSGVYSVPAGQGTTVFGFVYVYPAEGSNGNVLDNIVFASGSPPNPASSISFGNEVALTAKNTRAGYAYGIAEIRGSSVSLTSNALAYYDPDGAGPLPETEIRKTAELGIAGWYSTDEKGAAFAEGGVIRFGNLTPGKTYRIVGIPQLAINNRLHTNESPEYVLDEGYFRDMQTPPVFAGDDSTIWNVEVDMYMDGTKRRARVVIGNAREDVEYALLADRISAGSHFPVTSQPAHRHTGWIHGTAGTAMFDNLELDTYYYIVARPYGYAETTYRDAAFDVDGKTPAYLRLKTPGGVKDVEPNNILIQNCRSIRVQNSLRTHTYALVNPVTGAIIGNTQNGNGATLEFPIPAPLKTCRIVARSGDVNWMRGVRVYGCPKSFMIDYPGEAVRSSRDKNGNIPKNVEYNIRSQNAGTTWILGNQNSWTAGLGTQPVDLATKTLAGNTRSILDSITALAANAILSYRMKAGFDGYTGPSVSPSLEISIHMRPAAPSRPGSYTYDFVAERINVVSGFGLQFSPNAASRWMDIAGGGSWSFAGTGWGEGTSKRLFDVRSPATDVSFMSQVRVDTLPARPAAPNVNLSSNTDISKTVITGMTAGVRYQYSTSLDTKWIDCVTSSDESDSINYAPGVTCFVRFAATSDAPASLNAVLASPICLMPVFFADCAYGDKPSPEKLVVKNTVALPVDIVKMELVDENAKYYRFYSKPQNDGEKRVPARGTNTNWSIIPVENLDAGKYNTTLKMTYLYKDTEYTALASVYLVVQKKIPDMSKISGAFDVARTEARQLVLNVVGAPAGSRLSYYYGSTVATGSPESTVALDGSTSCSFTSANGINPSTAYSVSARAQEDKNYYASPITPLATGYTAYATPVFDDIVTIDYASERMIFVSEVNSGDYTVQCILRNNSPIIESPHILRDILDRADTDSIMFSIMHNASADPPCPASAIAYSKTVKGRAAAPPVNAGTVTPASNISSYDGKINIAGNFEYRIHGTAVGWNTASNTAAGLGTGDYDVRYPAGKTAFASRQATVTLPLIVKQPSSVDVVKCCIHDTLSVGVHVTSNTVEYQWYVNTVNSASGGVAIDGAKADRFAVPLTLEIGTYYYYCQIRVGGTAIPPSDLATVRVSAPKGRIASVSPSELCRGNEINLKFSGTPPHEVWYGTVGEDATYEYSFVVTGSDTAISADVVGIYTFKNMSAGHVCSCADIYTVKANSTVVSGVAGDDQLVCSDSVPVLLKSTAASGGFPDRYVYQWQESDDGSTWTNIPAAESSEYQPSALKQTRLYRLLTGSSESRCGTDTSNTVTVRVRPTVDYPDLRLRICPDGTKVNLSKYINSTGITNIKWTGTSNVKVSSPEGLLETDKLANSHIHTFTYTVSNVCVTGIERKAYVETLGYRIAHYPKDTVEICYLHAETILVNQILGIEAGGKWTYDNTVAPYVTESTSAIHGGAITLNGKGLYEADAVPAATYRGNAVKIATFTYSPNTGSCLSGETCTVVIVLTK
jgi:hypothetical protein